MEQQQSRHPLLQIKQPDINITSVDKKVLSGHYANHSLYGMKKTTQIWHQSKLLYWIQEVKI
jgi:hypothetical protein